MSEQAAYASDQPKSDDDLGPIRKIGGSMDQALDVMEKSIARLQARLQPVLRESEPVAAVPRGPDVREDMGVSPLSRSYQEQLWRIDVMTSRIQELASDCTL